MSGSAGRRHKAHIAARNYFRATGAICHEPGCNNPASVADHYPPLSTGLPFERYLPHCTSCSCRQGATIRNSRRHLDWPNQPTHPDRHVILIVGPPGAGKTTRALQLAHEYGLTHLEREMFRLDRDYKHAVQTFCSKPAAQAAIVRTCGTIDEQHEWQQLTGSTHLEVIATPFDVCASRIHARHRSGWRGEVAAAKRWHTTRARQGATPMTARTPSRQW